MELVIKEATSQEEFQKILDELVKDKWLIGTLNVQYNEKKDEWKYSCLFYRNKQMMNSIAAAKAFSTNELKN